MILAHGRAVLAMSFARPVVAPRLGCIGELLDDRGAFLYSLQQADGLTRAMKEALTADLAAMGRHNFELAKRLNWDDIARQTHELYQRSMACRTPAKPRS